MPENDLQQLFARLASPTVLTQLVLIAVAVLAGLVAGHFARNWYTRREAQRGRSWQTQVTEGAVVAMPAFATIVLLLIGRGLLGFTTVATTLVDIALQLAAALLLVRLLIYILRLALGPASWVVRWETRLTLVLWLLLGFSLLGWFDFVETQPRRHGPGAGQDAVHALVAAQGHRGGHHFRGGHQPGLARDRSARDEDAWHWPCPRASASASSPISSCSALGVLVGINAAGVDLTALTVLTGAMGLGLGFGLQAIASNFVSGFVLLMDKSIKPGDVISFTGVTGHQHRELRLGAGAARPLRGGARPRWRGYAGARTRT